MEGVDTVNRVLKEFGDAISLPELKLKDGNWCVLCVDGTQSIQLNYNEQRNSLDFITEIGALPDENESKCCDYLLKANAEWEITQGITLSKQLDKNSILLGYQLPILNLSLNVFEKTFDQFLKQIETWKTYLVQLGQGELPDILAAY